MNVCSVTLMVLSSTLIIFLLLHHHNKNMIKFDIKSKKNKTSNFVQRSFTIMYYSISSHFIGHLFSNSDIKPDPERTAGLTQRTRSYRD
ncbi:hypothetical protein PR048_026782 [Dryococelus australis]|uniref:Uncharacterized protein n=1 Tax=Dryococelus australis TaxID=614101 RepID=A0ABQ9GMB2_9NEOP|nr:hypothetical protein PR048_026782 [Dryococelus australis]